MVSVHCPRCGHSNRVKRWTAVTRQDARSTPPPTSAWETRIASVGGRSVTVDRADDEDDETYIYDERGRLVLAEWTEDGRLVAAARRPATGAHVEPRSSGITWPEAIAMVGWRLDPVADGCQIRTPDGICIAEAVRYITGGWVCGQHYYALASVIIRRSA